MSRVQNSGMSLLVSGALSLLKYCNRAEFERVSEGLADALDFSRTIGAEEEGSYEGGGRRGVLGEVDFYTSHEGLMLNYEEALTRKLPIPPSARRLKYANASPSHSRSPTASIPGSPATSGFQSTVTGPKGYYNTSAHFIWVGDRTRQLDGAHIEYLRGVRNPIGVKVGPSMDVDELVQLLDSKCISDIISVISRYTDRNNA